MNDEMANRISQGIISGLILTAIISLIFYISRRLQQKKLQGMSNQNQPRTTSIFHSFFQTIENKGVRRLIIVMGVLLPLLLSVLIWYNEARVIENDYGETIRYYDESVFFVSLFFTFISYWILYAVIIWIYKGFQESKK